MRTLVVISPDPVVTWEEAKAHLRLDGDDEQALVVRLIAAATAHIDGPNGWLGRALGPQTLEARARGFCDTISLPYRPIIDVESVHYLDDQGQSQLVDPATYELVGDDLGTAWGQSWPTPGVYRGNAETVRIRYRAGYAVDPAANTLVHAVPEPIRAAILLMVGDLWHQRQSFVTGTISSAVPMSMTVENLLSPFRVYR